MKCDILILILITLIKTIESNVEKWQTQQLNYQGKSLKVVFYKGIDPHNILKLISQVDKSMITTTPNVLEGEIDGFIRSNDVILCSKRLLMWFSLALKSERKVRSGGGHLSGLWELKYSKDQRTLTFNRSKVNGYIQNLLLPGSTPNVGLFGSDVFGGYSGKKVVWGIEHSIGTELTNKFGKDILGLDKGAYSSDKGVFIEFQGIIGNSGVGSGFETPTDTDPRKGIVGKTIYTLTYRVPAKLNEYIQEVTFQVVENNFGPISTAYMALFLPGHNQTNMVFAGYPDLIPTNGINLRNKKLNKYFKNTCIHKIWFYEIPFKKIQGKKIAAHTPNGRGILTCIGAPVQYVPFICGYPNNKFIPKKAQSEYTLEISDNQSLDKFGRFHSINYKLLNNQSRNLLFSTEGKRKIFSMIMKYRVIDASSSIFRNKDGTPGVIAAKVPK